MSLLEKLNRLNGWQRIFCAFIAFIYLPITVALISEEKYIDRLTTEQFFKLIPTDISSEKIFLVENIKRTDVKAVDFIAINYDFGYTWHYQIMISDSVGETNATIIGEKIGKVLGNEYSKKVLLARLEQFFFFLLGAILIYLFGWTLGWVKKGFTENKN